MQKLNISDVQRLAEMARHANPIVAGPARERINALARDRGRFTDQESWLLAYDLTRGWRLIEH